MAKLILKPLDDLMTSLSCCWELHLSICFLEFLATSFPASRSFAWGNFSHCLLFTRVWPLSHCLLPVTTVPPMSVDLSSCLQVLTCVLLFFTGVFFFSETHKIFFGGLDPINSCLLYTRIRFFVRLHLH